MENVWGRYGDPRRCGVHRAATPPVQNLASAATFQPALRGDDRPRIGQPDRPRRQLIEPASALPALELTLDVHQRLARLTRSPRVHPAGLCSLLAVILIGAIMCRTKITVQSGAERHPKDPEAAG
jgi:hypothetical protein